MFYYFHNPFTFVSFANTTVLCRHIYMYIHIYVYIYIYTCLLLASMPWHRQAIFESKGDKLSSSAECKIRSWEVSDTNSPAHRMPTHKHTELSRIKLKPWTQQPVPMMNELSAHLTSLPIGFRTWLWRYISPSNLRPQNECSIVRFTHERVRNMHLCCHLPEGAIKWLSVSEGLNMCICVCVQYDVSHKIVSIINGNTVWSLLGFGIIYFDWTAWDTVPPVKYIWQNQIYRELIQPEIFCAVQLSGTDAFSKWDCKYWQSIYFYDVSKNISSEFFRCMFDGSLTFGVIDIFQLSLKKQRLAKHKSD